MKKSVVLLAVLSLSVSCSKVEKAEKNMDQMKNKTEQMSATTDEMKETTTVMYQQIRSKEAEDTRNKKFEILTSKDEGFGAKIAAAAVYFKSFEYQLWTAQKGFDDAHARDVMLLDAANEFTKRMCDLYEKINTRKMSPTKDGRAHRDEQAFYALAVTMHMNHHYQEELVDSKISVQGISFYDVIKKAIDKDGYGQSLTDYEEVLVSGINKEIMIELIKARVDMLSALALKNLTDKRDMTLGQKVKGLLFKLSGGKLGSIDLPETYVKANEPTKKQTINYLEAAVKAKNFLDKQNIPKELEKTLKSAYSKIELGNPARQESDNEVMEVGETKAESDQKKVEIRSLIDVLLQ